MVQMERVMFHVTYEVFGRGRVVEGRYYNYETALKAYNNIPSGRNKDLRKTEILEHDYYMDIDAHKTNEEESE